MPSIRRFLPLLAAAAAVLIIGRQPAAAHHGRDFLLVQDYYLPGLLDGVLVNNFEATRTDTDFEYGLEPEILIGILPRVAVGVSVGFVDQPGAGWTYDSVMPSVHIQITPPDSDFPIRLAVSAAYEFASGDGAAGHLHGSPAAISSKSASSAKSRPATSSTRRRGSQTSSSKSNGLSSSPKPLVATPSSPPVESYSAPGDGGVVPAVASTLDSGTAPGTGTDLGPDAPPGGTPVHDHSSHDHGSHDHGSSAGPAGGTDPAATGADPAQAEGAGHDHTAGGDSHHHGGSSIHSHGQDAFIGRLILEADLTDADKLVLNLLNVTPAEGEGAWGYAAGVRHNLTHQFSLSLEAMGDFSEDGYHEINVGAFLVPDHHITLRAGVGFGLTPASPDLALRAGVVWRF